MTGVREPLLRHLLGDLLRRLRQRQGRTLADVAAEAQVSMPYLSEVERGLKEASSEVLAAICRSLGLTVVELLELATQEHAPVATVTSLTQVTSLAELSGPASSTPAPGTMMLLAS